MVWGSGRPFGMRNVRASAAGELCRAGQRACAVPGRGGPCARFRPGAERGVAEAPRRWWPELIGAWGPREPGQGRGRVGGD